VAPTIRGVDHEHLGEQDRASVAGNVFSAVRATAAIPGVREAHRANDHVIFPSVDLAPSRLGPVSLAFGPCFTAGGRAPCDLHMSPQGKGGVR